MVSSSFWSAKLEEVSYRHHGKAVILPSQLGSNLAMEFWVVKEAAAEAPITAAEAVKKALESAGVEMPFPQRTLSFAADQKLKVEVSNSAN